MTHRTSSSILPVAFKVSITQRLFKKRSADGGFMDALTCHTAAIVAPEIATENQVTAQELLRGTTLAAPLYSYSLC